MKAMIEPTTLFADTYALIGIIQGRKDYRPYLSRRIITSKYNLIEMYYYFLRTYDEKIADKYFRMHEEIIIPITFSNIRTGMKFKLKNKKEKLSYVDCIGYAMAMGAGIRFLTGDQKFESKNNVEFVK